MSTIPGQAGQKTDFYGLRRWRAGHNGRWQPGVVSQRHERPPARAHRRRAGAGGRDRHRRRWPAAVRRCRGRDSTREASRMTTPTRFDDPVSPESGPGEVQPAVSHASDSPRVLSRGKQKLGAEQDKTHAQEPPRGCGRFLFRCDYKRFPAESGDAAGRDRTTPSPTSARWSGS